MAPVILRMHVHCYGCAGKIRRVVKNLLGVEEVWVSVDTRLVVVSGTSSLDAWQLRRRIQAKTRRHVTVVSDGGGAEPPEPQHQSFQYAAPPPGYPAQHHHYYGSSGTMMQYVGPPPAAAAAYPYYYGGGGVISWVPSAPEPPQHLLQYVPNEAPVCFNDENPNGCCAVQ